MTMRSFRAELHTHTVLSPCAQVEMIPPLIVREAVRRGIDLIAVTDHNAMANFPAVLAAAESLPLAVLPGVELQTREEIHLLCLFAGPEQAADFQQLIDRTLPGLQNDPQYFGEQYVVDSTGEFIRSDDRLLLASTTLALEEAVSEVHTREGLAIPAHIDRKAFGLIPNLGFVPPGLAVDALEISRRLTPDAARDLFPQIREFPLLLGGDAHHPDELLGANVFWMQAPTIPEIRLALRGQEGRMFTVECSR